MRPTPSPEIDAVCVKIPLRYAVVGDLVNREESRASQAEDETRGWRQDICQVLFVRRCRRRGGTGWRGAWCDGVWRDYGEICSLLERRVKSRQSGLI